MPSENKWPVTGGGGGTGSVTGPATSTDNAVARFNGTDGTAIKNSPVTIDDSGNVATPGTVDGRDVSVDGAALDSHVANTSNPHNTTKAQVGLGNVENAAASTLYVPLTQKGANNGVATLDAGGLIPSSQLPPIAITDTFVVASQAAQTALTAEVGDVAVRTDLNKSYILRASPASTFSNWQELLTPTDSVLSVNGQTGVVSLTKSDVGLSAVDNTSDATKNAATATLSGKTLADPIIQGDAAAPTYAEGKMWYDTVDKTMRYYNNSSNFSSSFDQSSLIRVFNSTGTAMTKGQLVSLTTTSTGTLPNVVLSAGNTSTGDSTVGILAEAIAIGGTGYAVTAGIIENIDTSAFSAGAQLYPHSSTAGAMQVAIPIFAKKIGRVVVSSATVGSIFVQIDNQAIPGPGANNQMLISSGSAPNWRSPTAYPISLSHTGTTIKFGLDAYYAPNAIANGDFETGVNIMTAYNNGAVAIPTTGTGGTATGITSSTITTGQLQGTTTGSFVKDAANRQGCGVAIPFTLPSVYKSKMLNIQFDVGISAGTYATGDLTVYVYDITGAALITPTITSIPNSTGRFATRFQATANTSYRLLIHVATTSALTYTVLFDAFSIDNTLPVSGQDGLYEGGLVNKVISTTATLQAGVTYLTNTTSAAFTATLPKGYVGARLRVEDAKGTWATNPLTLAPAAGDAIGQLATNATLVCSTKNGWVQLAWDGATWSATSSVSGGGLAPVAVSANVTLAANNTMYSCTSTGGFTITLPAVPTLGGVIGVMDAGETCSTTNFIRVTPATGQSIDGFIADDSLVLDYARANAVFYAAPGATSWKVQYQATSMVQGGQVPGKVTGLATATGFIGEMPLGSIKGSNQSQAFTYSSTSTTALSTTGATLITGPTLNKGTYLATWKLRFTTSAATTIYHSIRVGSSDLPTSDFTGGTHAAWESGVSGSLPFDVATDGQVVTVRGSVSSGSTSGNFHELWIVRIG